MGDLTTKTMWAMLREVPGGAVLESFWPATSVTHVTAGLDRADTHRPLEIWCEVPVEVARTRFEQRQGQHTIHGATEGAWQDDWAEAGPLTLFPLLRVDTTTLVDLEKVVGWIADR